MDGTPSIPVNMNAMQAPQSGHDGITTPAGSPPEPAAVIEQFGGDQRRSVDRLVAGLRAYYEPQLRQARQSDTEARRKLGEEEGRSKELAEQLGETQQVAANLHIQNGDLKKENDGLKAKVRDGEAAAVQKEAEIERLLAKYNRLQTKYENLENGIKGTFGHIFQTKQGGRAGSAGPAAEPVTPRSEPAGREELRASPAPSEPGAPEQRASPSLSPPPLARLAEPRPEKDQDQTARAPLSPSAAIDLTGGDDNGDAPEAASPQSATQSPAKFGPTEIIEGAMKEAHAHDPATLEIRLRQLREKGPVRYAIWNKWRFLKDKASLSEAKKKEKLVARFRAKFPQLWLRYDPSTEATAGDNELAASEALQRRGVMSTAAESADAGDADGPSAQAEERAAKRRRAAFAARGTEMVYSSDVEEFEAGRSGGEGDSDGEFLPACEQGEEDEGEERSKRARREPSDAL